MRKEVRKWCLYDVLLTGSCQLEQTRWFSDLFRDWILHGPVGGLVAQVLNTPATRVYQEGAFGHRKVFDKSMFSYEPHVDSSGTVGFFGGVSTNTSGAALWMPLMDVDPVTDGGSIRIFKDWVNAPCKHFFGVAETNVEPKTWNLMEHAARCNSDSVKKGEVVPTFKAGDVVIWHPDMLHATQDIFKMLPHVRYSWYARIIAADATSCMYRCLPPSMPCCQPEFGPGQTIQGACFPQTYPKTIPAEEQAHFGSTPRPLMTEYRGLPRGPGNYLGRYWKDSDMPDWCQVALKHTLIK